VAPRDELPRWWFVGVAAASAALLMVLSRNVFLFWDDFVFLGQAREGELSWEHLTDPLFRHFSPVVRAVNLAVVGAVPQHPWVILLVQCLLLAGVAGAVTWLMVSLFGRTVRALVGSVLLAPSLTLLPLGNWWTAGVNIMPALIGFYVSFGAMVQLLRGRSPAWVVPCFVGAAVGVLDYELPMLLVGYLAAWFVLCGPRLTKEPLSVLLRRTWWVWLGLLAIDVAAALNYRLNYYDEAPTPDSGDVVHALGRSLVRTLVPTALGFHDPRSERFSAAGLVLGCVVLVILVGWLLTTRRGAWRGLLFAAGGWLLPTLALVLNRVSIFGVVVVDNAIYFHLPTVLFVVGVLEATLAPRRGEVSPLALTARARLLLVPIILVPVAGYAWSAHPTSVYQLPAGATPDFAEQARRSAVVRLAEGSPFAVVNSDVPGNVVPEIQTPYNRADRVLGVIAPPLVFDRPEEVLYRVGATGELVPTTITWFETTPGTGVLRFVGAPDREPGPEGSTCFTATDGTEALWTLPEPVTAPDLVVRTMAGVDDTTSVRVTVRPDSTGGFDRANVDEHTIGPEDAGVLDTVSSPAVTTVRLKGFTPGVRVCLESVAVGHLTPAG
jgi:hypothetical protein